MVLVFVAVSPGFKANKFPLSLLPPTQTPIKRVPSAGPRSCSLAAGRGALLLFSHANGAHSAPRRGAICSGTNPLVCRRVIN